MKPRQIGLGAAGVILATLFGVGFYLWSPLPAAPSAAILAKDAALYDVEIIRDDWGVPHIYGTTDADVAFGVGYAHSEDDFETIQEMVAATRGVLARYHGAAAAPTDYIVGLLGIWQTIEDKYETDVAPDVKEIADAYAAGLNLYASENPKATWAGLAPFTGRDVVAGFIFKTPFFYGLDKTLLALFGDERAEEIALDPSEDRTSWHVAPKSLAQRGSNAFAVAPHRSGDGATRLMINSHQPMTGPVAWYEAHLVSKQGLNITGGLFPGTPMILHGFNRNLGWANTVSAQDLADVYRLVINPEDQNQYKLDGAWRNFEKSSVEIQVKLFGPFVFTTTRPVLRSAHGPVVQAPHGTYALRYAGMGEIRQLEQYYRLNQAQSLDEFLKAMALNALPSINYIYADRAGNVGFIHNAQYPARKEGWDWKADMPGDRSDLIWQGYLPFDKVPKLINPSSGFVYNANNTPFQATDGPDNLKRASFPEFMGLQADETNRSLRLQELTDGTSLIGRDRVMALKFDTGYAAQSVANKLIQKILAIDWASEPRLEKAAVRLAAWDLKLDVNSRYAALGGLTVIKEVTEKFTGDPAPAPEEAFRFAVDYLMKHHGRIDPTWGEVNRLVRGDVNIPIGGGADILRAIYPAEIREDGRLHANAGDTWIAHVQWDKDGNQTADLIHQFGSATLDTTSTHFADQAPLFAKQEWRRALIDKKDVEAKATRRYRPGTQ